MGRIRKRKEKKRKKRKRKEKKKKRKEKKRKEGKKEKKRKERKEIWERSYLNFFVVLSSGKSGVGELEVNFIVI